MVRINQIPGEVTFKQAIKDFFRGYFDFKGRTTRAGYWSIIFLIFMFEVLSIPLNKYLIYLYATHQDIPLFKMVFSLLFICVCSVLILIQIVIQIPLLSLNARRLCDIGCVQLLPIFIIYYILIYVVHFWIIHYCNMGLLQSVFLLYVLKIPIFIMCCKKSKKI